MKRVLITGVTGFVGHHFFEHIMKNTNWHVVGLARSSIAGDLHRLSEVLKGREGWNHRLTVIHHDLRDSIHELMDERIGHIDYVFHIGASSHVDRSILYPLQFLRDNVEGTVNLLEWLRKRNEKPTSESPGVEKFLYFGTDEVYGPAPEGVFYKESDRVHPGNPYSASKLAAEAFCMAYQNTYGLPILITRCMNIIGERQHPEKYVPLIIGKILKGGVLKIHSDPSKTQPGKRHYLHARNIASACVHLIESGVVGEVYNVVGDKEMDNLELAKLIESFVREWFIERGVMGVDEAVLKYELVDFHSSRPGHDLRYALDGSKLRESGFSYPVNFEETLKKVVYWTLDHPEWLA